ncbi:DUF3231 family protein [Bacillus sp. ISL-40]|uniref:DUF3231 family protein n=1 Tax=unclassified Bacillus (in: firmicutes) TaxID=185979 RepID=UPI001BE57A56|nr:MULTISPECIES: DUF3231 family protein [unclassified Bacillus (in: firmicutes)]MBT2697485.1 DUF3231 family protein [Bacillus sp. ISL-40]MBT2720965.1 DUF3231 family protein [Bacillus sp. ISL-46]MBT2742190.1 DUF3231 family protein [Bacillus sp. ISL-77]
MEDKIKIRLTAAEMSTLWSQYLSDTLAVCVSSYFIEKVEDEEVRPIIEFTLDVAKGNITIMQELFKKENFPVPIGFTDQDINPKAPKLFSDTFVLMFFRNMSILALAASSAALGLVTQADIVDFHKRILNSAVKLQDLTRDLMLEQGTYIRPPYISTPDKVDFVKRDHFLAGFFGHKRPITSVEVTHLFLNIQTNMIGKALITGYAQIAQDQEVKEFLVRGMQIAQQHANQFSEILIKEDLPAPMSRDSAVTDSTVPVFSDKLIMFNISSMIAAGIGNYGMAIAASPRRDIALKYAALIPEISLYAEAGAKIMIKHGWMEEPPQADDRDKIIQG